MREIVKRMYDVRYDIDTGDMYYYHILKKTKQQLKPRIMGHDKLTPPDYARVRNEKNVALYVVFERENFNRFTLSCFNYVTLST